MSDQPAPAPGAPGGGDWQRLMTFQPQAPAPANPTRRPAIRQILAWSAVVVVFGLAALVMTLLVTDAIGPLAAALALVSSALALGIVIPLFLWVLSLIHI